MLEGSQLEDVERLSQTTGSFVADDPSICMPIAKLFFWEIKGRGWRLEYKFPRSPLNRTPGSLDHIRQALKLPT